MIEDYEIYSSEYYEGLCYQESIFLKDLIDSFIWRTSSINREEYIDRIRRLREMSNLSFFKNILTSVKYTHYNDDREENDNGS